MTAMTGLFLIRWHNAGNSWSMHSLRHAQLLKLFLAADGWIVWEMEKILASVCRVPHSMQMILLQGAGFHQAVAFFSNRNGALGLVGGQDELLSRYEDFDWFLSLAIKGFRFEPQAIVGAMITRKRLVDPSVSQRSVHTIIHKWRKANLPADMMQRLEAYLALEQAAAFFFSGRILAAAKYILVSFWRVPRLRLQLSPGWDRRSADVGINCFVNIST